MSIVRVIKPGVVWKMFMFCFNEKNIKSIKNFCHGNVNTIEDLFHLKTFFSPYHLKIRCTSIPLRTNHLMYQLGHTVPVQKALHHIFFFPSGCQPCNVYTVLKHCHLPIFSSVFCYRYFVKVYYYYIMQ